MNRDDAINKILEAYKIKERNVEFIRRVFSLKDNAEVKDVYLIANKSANERMVLEVQMRDLFKNTQDFFNYLKEHELPTERAWSASSSYILKDAGITANFRKASARDSQYIET